MGKTDQQVADLLNTPATDTLARDFVAREDLIGDLGGLMSGLILAKYDGSNPTKQAQANYWLDLYDHTLGLKQTLNMSNALVIAFFGQLTAQGWLTPVQQSNLFVWNVSRAEAVLGHGALVTASDVHTARIGAF